MKTILLFLLISTSCLGYEIVPIIRNEQEVKFDGTFQYIYETGDGITHQAVGDSNQVRGNYKYTSPDGTPIEVTYVADENGFQPYGDHIPAIPEPIQRALEYIRTHPSSENQDEQKY